jgi:hypothetical protein
VLASFYSFTLEQFFMKFWLAAVALMTVSSLAHADSDSKAITVYQDPNCGCCSGWVDHMKGEGFEVTAIKTQDVASVKQKLGVPAQLSSCHTGVINETGQIIEGHVPANVVRKMLANSTIKGVAAPGMPLNAPGMGKMNGNLVTVDFTGKPFSKD